jgi:hypothetical protein
MLLVRLGRLEEGLADIRSAVENRRRNRPGTLTLAMFLAAQAGAEIEMGRLADAARDLDEEKAILDKIGQKAPSGLFDDYFGPRIRLALASGHPKEATQWTSSLYIDTSDSAKLDVGNILNALQIAEVDLANDRDADAKRRAVAVRTLIEQSPLAVYYGTYVSRASFVEGEAARRLGDVDAAMPLLRRVLQQRQHDLDPNSEHIAEVQVALGESAVAKGDFVTARTFADSAAAILDAHAELRPQYRQSLQRLQKEIAASR